MLTQLQNQVATIARVIARARLPAGDPEPKALRVVLLGPGAGSRGRAMPAPHQGTFTGRKRTAAAQS